MKEKREKKEEKEIIIPVPKNKQAVMIENQDGIQIIWQEKELTWATIRETLIEKRQFINLPYIVTDDTNDIKRKANLLIKLINIRNYFGKPNKSYSGFSICKILCKGLVVVPAKIPYMYSNEYVVFTKEEHAKQAIKILGDEINILFTPW